MHGEQGYGGVAVETRHGVPKCQACGYIGQWNVEPLLLTHHILITIFFMLFFGGGLIYLLIVVISRSNESSRGKVCPSCGAKNMHTFVYADQAPGWGPSPAAYGAPPAQYPGPAPRPAAQTVMAPQAVAGSAMVLHLNSRPLVTLALTPGHSWSVGRSSECQIIVDDPLVSGSHADIRVQPDGSLQLVDRGSTNGTFVNGSRITGGHRLQPGDRVALGSESALLTVQPA
jgi:hypothetical protein